MINNSYKWSVDKNSNSSFEELHIFGTNNFDLISNKTKTDIGNTLSNDIKISKLEDLSISSVNIPGVVYNFRGRKNRISALVNVINDTSKTYLEKQEFYYGLPGDKNLYESLLFLEIANDTDFINIAQVIIANGKQLETIDDLLISVILNGYSRLGLNNKFMNLLLFAHENNFEVYNEVINNNRDFFDKYYLDYSSEDTILNGLEEKFKTDYTVAKEIVQLMGKAKVTRKIGKLYFDYLTLNDFKNISRQQNISNQTELNLNLILEQFLIRTGYYKKAYVLFNYLEKINIEIFDDIKNKYITEGVEEKVIQGGYNDDLDSEIDRKSKAKMTLEITHKVSNIDGLELRFHLQQIPGEYEELIEKSKTMSDTDWLKFYKGEKVKSIILKMLYLEKLKKEDYKSQEFTRFLMDFKSFKKFEFLYLILDKELEFGDIHKAIRTLTHIHKMGGVKEEPIGLVNKYKSFFDIIKGKNISNINDFNIILKYFFDNSGEEIAHEIYKNVPSKAGETRSDLLILRNADTEKIFYSSIDDKKVIREFGNIGYHKSDRGVYNNTYLVIAERFLDIGKIDYALKSINKLFLEGGKISEEFFAKNSEFVKKYCSLKLDFSDNKTLINGLIEGLTNEDSYTYALEVIKTMNVLTIEIQHGILNYLKDSDLLLIFNRTLGAKAIKGGGIELGLYALDFLKRFIKIGDKSRCTSSRNSAIALGVKIPKSVEEDYDEMVRVGDIKNTKFLGEFVIFEKLFKDGKYKEAKERYNDSELGRSLGVAYYTIYIENLNDEDFVIEKIKGLNLATKSEKFLNICLNKAFKLDITKVDQSLFFNTYTFIEDLLKKIDKKKYRLTEENLELYKEYLHKKNNKLLPVLKKDSSKSSSSKKIMLDQNISFTNEEIKFIDSLSRHNSGGKYGTIDNNESEINLQNKGVILKYLLLTNYDKGVEYFAGTSKSNELIFVFATYARKEDIINKFDPILLFLLKEKTNLKIDVNKTFNDNQFANVRKQDVYRIIKEKLLEEGDKYIERLKKGLELIGFKDLDKAFTSSILYKISGYDFKQKHLDNIIEISKLDSSIKFHRNYLRDNYNYLTYLSNVHIRGEKKGANRDEYSNALIEIGEILLKDGKINKEQFSQLELFFNNLKKDHSKGVGSRKIGLTLFEVVNNEYNSNINDIITEGSFNEIELGGENIKLSERGVFLYYLFKTDYNKAISYFGGNGKTNQSILLFSTFAKNSDIDYYKDNISNYFGKQRPDNQDSAYSKGEYKGYTNIRSDFVFNVMSEQLPNEYDGFLSDIKIVLSTKGFKNFNKRQKNQEEFDPVKLSVSNNVNNILDKFNSGEFWDIDRLLD